MLDGQVLGCACEPDTIRAGLPLEAACLFAVSDDGRRLAMPSPSLTDSMPAGLPGGPRQKVEAPSLLVSDSAFDPAAPVKEASVGLVGLREWAGSPTGSQEPLLDDGGLRIGLSRADDADALESARLVLSFGEGLPLDDVCGLVGRLSGCMSFFCCFPADVTSLDVIFANGSDPVACHVPYVTGGRHVGDGAHGIPLTREALGGHVGPAMLSWLETKGDLAAVRRMIVALASESWQMPLDVEFLMVSQALEALAAMSGATSDEMSADDSDGDFDSMRGRVLKALPPGELKDWANRHIKRRRHGNAGTSKARLLRGLLTRHEAAREWLRIEDVDAFVGRHVRSRDYYTHRLDRPDDLLAGLDLRTHTEGLLLLCHCVLADMSGIPEELDVGRLHCTGVRHGMYLRFTRLYRESES